MRNISRAESVIRKKNFQKEFMMTTTTTSATNKSTNDDTRVVANTNTDSKTESSTLPSPTLKKRRLSRKEQKMLSKQKKRRTVNGDDEVVDQRESSETSKQSHPTGIDPTIEHPMKEKRHEDFLTNYEPISFITNSNANAGNHISTSTTKVASLGKWFPKAIQLKRTIAASTNQTEHNRKAAILLFYQYINPQWSQQKLQQVQDYLIRIGQARINIAGRIRIANEGLNVTLSAIDDSNGKIDAVTSLHYFVQDLVMVDDVFRTHTDFKYITDLSSDRHFHSYHIIPVQELVFYGFSRNNSAGAKNDGTKSEMSTSGAKHVPPEVFHRLLAGEDIATCDDGLHQKTTSSDEGTEIASSKKKDIVVIDVRNHYEAVLGRFDGQEFVSTSTSTHNNESSPSKTTSVAKYIDPKMRKSTDFPLWVQQNASALVKKDRILLYCTGGIRCERASEHLSSVLHNELKQYKKELNADDIGHITEDVDKSHNRNAKDQPPEIFQLQGGIEKYLQTFKDSGGGFWRGKNFTFDKREAISADNMNGDGGVLKTVTKKSKKSDMHSSDDTETAMHAPTGNHIAECKCVLCQNYWDRYIGKKKCCTCGVPILVCERCCSTKKEQIRKSGKCPICIEENITVPVTDVAYTNNGKQTKLLMDAQQNTVNVNTSDFIGVPRASCTVLKWGGGHGSNKHGASAQKRKCKFGGNCHRSDCIFDHPLL